MIPEGLPLDAEQGKPEESIAAVPRGYCHTPDRLLEDTRDVSKFLAELIIQLRRGQLDPKVANALGYLASVLLRALEQGRIEQRLAHLEAILAKSEAASGVFEFHPRTENTNERPHSTSAID